MDLETFREIAALAGLHLVTDADKTVLDAVNAMLAREPSFHGDGT